MSLENKVQLMWNCSTALEPKTHTHKLLKSFYMNMCRKLAKNSLQIPKEKFSTSQMCSRCGCFWSESEFSMKLRPQQAARNSKSKKLIEKLEKSKESEQRGLLSRQQRKRAKWLQKRVHNYVQMKCEQCKHKSLIKMEKPKTKQRKEENSGVLEKVEIVIEESDAPMKKKKNKKTKNKTAGLKLALPSGKQVVIEAQKVKKANENKKHCQSQSLPGEDAKIKIQKTKQKKKTKQKSTTGVPSTKTSKKNHIVSKTQKQNSLLQLAALLKQQTSTATGDGRNSAQKRLESLLK